MAGTKTVAGAVGGGARPARPMRDRLLLHRGPVHVISLWQPWASFVAWGFKTVETRSWKPRVPPGCGCSPVFFAIHAAKKKTYDRLLPELWVRAEIPGTPPGLDFLPHGRIIATAEYQGWGPTESADVSARDLVLGDFTPGRFAWYLGETHLLDVEILFPGHQGIRPLDAETRDQLLSAEYRRVR